MSNDIKKNKVVSIKNLPKRLPLFPALTSWLMLDRFHAPQWLFGAVGAFFLLISIIVTLSWMNEEEKDIFQDQ